MNIGDRVHLYYHRAYNKRGRVVEIIGSSIRVDLEGGGEVTCPACDSEWLASGSWEGRRLTDDDGEPMIPVEVPRAAGDDGQGGYHSIQMVRQDVCRTILDSPLVKEVLQGGNGVGAEARPENEVGIPGIVQGEVSGEAGELRVQLGKGDVVATLDDGKNGGGEGCGCGRHLSEVEDLLRGVARGVLTALKYPRGSEAQVRCLEGVGQDAEYALGKFRS